VTGAVGTPGAPIDARVTLRCLREDLHIAWPLATDIQDLIGRHDLLDQFLQEVPELRGPGLWLACARPELLRRFRHGQWRGVSWEDGPRVWLVCGGLRRQGDSDDAYTYCCQQNSAVGLKPTAEDQDRLDAERPFRAMRSFLKSARQAMSEGLAEARLNPDSEIAKTATDGTNRYQFSLWCTKVDPLVELTCIVTLCSASGLVRLTQEQLEMLTSFFLEGRPAGELEFPWPPPRAIHPTDEYCFRRLVGA
jgi:hypothetical protein